jgi:hypothetical protein
MPKAWTEDGRVRRLWQKRARELDESEGFGDGWTHSEHYGHLGWTFDLEIALLLTSLLS